MAFHHHKKAGELAEARMECILQNNPVQQREALLWQASQLKSFAGAQADRERNTMVGNDFFIRIAEFGFGPGLFPSKEVLRK